MKIIFFLSILVVLFSCSEGSNTEKLDDDHDQPDLVAGIKAYQLETKFFEGTEFSNGDKIQHAQSSEDWKKACENNQPAWCYADSKSKKGVLYNYYAFSDKRGLVSKDKILNRTDIELFQNELKSNLKSIDFNWFIGSSIERSNNGINYNLKFVNFWIKDDFKSSEKVSVAVIDQKTNQLTIESVSQKNGYRIWLKK